MNKPTKTDSGQWQVRWTDERGTRRKRSFDAHDDATAFIVLEKAKLIEIKVGARSPTPPDKTFQQLADYWLEHRVPMKRSGDHDKSILRAHLVPAFGHLQLRDLGVAEVDRFLGERIELDRKTVSNHLTLLLTMLNAAHDIGWLAKVPRIKKPKTRLFSRDFSYLRNNDEVAKFLSASAAEGELVYTLYAAAIYTGLRQGELAALRWSNVWFDKRLLCVEASFAGPTKGGDVRYAPLLDPLVPILQRWRLVCPHTPTGLVFPNRDGQMQGKSARVFQEALHRVLDDAGFPKVERRNRTRRYIVFHDLRHTFASHWVMNGGDVFKLQKILGHKSITMTMRYAHLAPEAYAGDHARLGTSAPPVNGVVVPMRPAARTG